MQYRPLTVKQEAFAAAMYTIGSQTYGNGLESARKAQYKGNKNALGQRAHELVNNSKIIAKKAEIQVKTEQKLDISREKQHQKLENAIDLAIKIKSPSAIVSAIREQNEMLGYHRDKAPNQERLKSLSARVTDEQRRILLECADLLLRKQVVSTVVQAPTLPKTHED